MTPTALHHLEADLWEAADALRANSKLTAAEYKDPVLGLVLLRFAQNKYEEAKPIVESKIQSGPRGKRKPTKEDYLAAGAIMLPEEAKYEYLAALPESKDIAAALNNAMKQIEAEYPDLQGNLPKNYQEFEQDLLRDLVRVFNKDAVKKATGDVFGRIYEYFLMKFSMQGAGAQEGGEFFTPPSLVQLIVNFIEPDHGIIHDPACGSGGMFVQTGYFVKGHTNREVNEAIKVYGTEQKTNNTRLAKINLAIHGIEGKIIESNSFYSDPHQLVGKCDFVMANPPFNVNKIDYNKEFVKTDKRLPFGLPKADNGNYLWIQYFYSYLNAKGRAGFVMASSATDAGHSEALIRQKLIETGAIECIVSIGNNFFYTRSLPCHLWFFNKGKSKATRDTLLMLDARNVFRKVTTTINDFSPGQMTNLTAIMQLYRGVKNAAKQTEAEHQRLLKESLEEIAPHHQTLLKELSEAAAELKLKLPLKDVKVGKLATEAEAQKTLDLLFAATEEVTKQIKPWQDEVKQVELTLTKIKEDDKEARKKLQVLRSKITTLTKPVEKFTKATTDFAEQAKQGIKDWKQWHEWFPEGDYRDVEGLCKVVNTNEVQENDYSLTPGRYVGVSLEVNDGFDYRGRLATIKEELFKLENESKKLSLNIHQGLNEVLL
jgi:type I restriction enzyme M protein